jgi:uncharacterized membrane protein
VFLVPFVLLLSRINADMLGELSILAFFAIFFGMAFRTSYAVAKSAKKSRGGRILKLAAIVPALTLVLIFAGPLRAVARMTLARFQSDTLASLSVTCAIFSVVFFSKIMPARTEIGRRYLDEVEGFEMYLNTAERHRFEALYPASPASADGPPFPKLSGDVFERLLPYAFALDIAETWADNFAGVLESRDYNPSWYNGGGTFKISSFAGSLRNACDSIRPVSASNSSGSGRGGRASSGGGRGGGGGRGR